MGVASTAGYVSLAGHLRVASQLSGVAITGLSRELSGAGIIGRHVGRFPQFLQQLGLLIEKLSQLFQGFGVLFEVGREPEFAASIVLFQQFAEFRRQGFRILTGLGQLIEGLGNRRFPFRRPFGVDWIFRRLHRFQSGLRRLATLPHLAGCRVQLEPQFFPQGVDRFPVFMCQGFMLGLADELRDFVTQLFFLLLIQQLLFDNLVQQLFEFRGGLSGNRVVQLRPRGFGAQRDQTTAAGEQQRHQQQTQATRRPDARQGVTPHLFGLRQIGVPLFVVRFVQGHQ